MAQSIPKKCKAMIVKKANDDLVEIEIDVPTPGENEVLIKMLACGVCHSDEAVRTGMMGNDFPRIPGHEVVGEVVAVGDHVKRWKVGDHVGGPWHGGHDGVCKQCQRSQFQMCPNKTINGVMRDGGYAEYLTLRSEAVVGIDKNADPAEVAPLLCAGVTLFNSIRKQKISPGEVVAIQGLGGLGHLGLQYSRKMGYRTVALSSSDKKKDFAYELGANDYVSGGAEAQAEYLQKLGGAALIVVTAPNPEIISPLLNGLDAGGKLLILAPVGGVQVDTITLITNGVSVGGWPSGHAFECEEAISFAVTHGVKCMIEKFKLSEANAAMKKMNEGHIRFRGVLLP